MNAPFPLEVSPTREAIEAAILDKQPISCGPCKALRFDLLTHSPRGECVARVRSLPDAEPDMSIPKGKYCPHGNNNFSEIGASVRPFAPKSDASCISVTPRQLFSRP